MREVPGRQVANDFGDSNSTSSDRAIGSGRMMDRHREKITLQESQRAPLEYAASARAAGLRYVSDARKGITRRRNGRGFRYFDAGGRRIRDTILLERIMQLAIPPAWNSVWICPDAKGHLQATGRDVRRRKQYRYHPEWRKLRDETKYDRMIAFGRALPKIRRRVARDLRRRGLPREKALATIVRLLETTLIRVGDDEYARDNRSYGLTTMQNRHVDIHAGTVTFRFRGKSGKKHVALRQLPSRSDFR